MTQTRTQAQMSQGERGADNRTPFLFGAPVRMKFLS